ncbi:MAG: GxxExxY protein [Phycisphaerales bacterium]|nr:GxxExxY protein [Phycisphaerales bacterium]
MNQGHHERGERHDRGEGRGRRPAVRNEELDPALTEVSRKVIGAAIETHTALGPGFDLGVYERALSLELKELSVRHSLNHRFPIMYRGQQVGEHAVSLFVDNRFVVQVMAVDREVSGFDRTALRAQLRAADLELGLIINFHRRRLKDGGLVRVLNPDKLEALKGDGDDDGDYEDEGH